MYVTCEYECWKLNSAGSERVDELQITKKQTPAWLCTHVMLEVLVLPSTQTIRTFWFSFSALVRGLATASIKKGKSSKSRIVQLSKVVDNLSKNLDRNVRLCDFLRSLIGLHSVTGCDTVAAFAGKGKYKAVLLALCNALYVRALLEIGTNLILTEETMVTVEAFVSQLYGKKCVSVDVLHFELHCAKGGKVASEVLPPC